MAHAMNYVFLGCNNILLFFFLL
ncbi:hypothetical protein LINPERHAP2_LOCUS39337, partial [Linum perenne]